jgi:3-hydroxyisobutyrate dehydrogenase-like beta-hydroxyacid dehydrogenase
MSSLSFNADSPGLCFIGFGEAATAFAKGWAGADLHRIMAWDIKMASKDRSVVARKSADYDKAGVTGATSLAEALEGSGIVFSLVTADQAHLAAAEAAPHIQDQALFLDCNSCAPGSKQKSADLIEAAGGRYVDVAIMAPVYPALHKTPLLVSGPHARAALSATQQLGMIAQEAAGEVGKASSIKMIRSIMVKGMEALVLETVLSARNAGVEDEVIASLDKSWPTFNWAERAAYMMERVTTHGIRRAAEMREVALTVDDLGLDGEMSRATVDWQQRVGDLLIGTDEENLNDDYKQRADAILANLARTNRSGD